MKNPCSMPPSQYKGDASQFYSPIAYSVLFGVPLQDFRVSGELWRQGNKLLLHSAECLPIKIRLKDTAAAAGQNKRPPEGTCCCFR